MQHHADTLQAFIREVEADEASLAVILTGSVARGQERPDSDVDLYLVVTEEAFARAAAADALSYVRTDVATWQGGYVDIKVASPAYLAAAAERADEPTRASFVGAQIAWSRVGTIDLAAITTLPEHEWAARARSFVAQWRLYGGYFLPQGEQLADPYLRTWAAVHLVNAAGRALLADAHVLFAGPKYLRKTVAALPTLPDGYDSLVVDLLEQASPEAGKRLMDAVEAFRDWPLTSETTLSKFVDDNELAWLRQQPVPEYF